MDDTFSLRKSADLKKLQELQGKLRSALEIVSVQGNPPSHILCRIRIPTARNAEYPRVTQDVSEVEIQLPARYPLEQPVVLFKTPIWNPNVYPSGKWCFGDWKVTSMLSSTTATPWAGSSIRFVTSRRFSLD